MNVNSITGDVAALKLQTFNSANSFDRAEGTPATKAPPVNQTAVAADNKALPANRPSLNAGAQKQAEAARVMSHVVASYNQQGKVRIKFMDSSNNVVYQIPTEMVAKMEDLNAEAGDIR